MDILDATWYELLISFVLTWTIGLTPPLLLRYGIVRRPLRKWVAISIVIVLWIVEFLFAIGMDSFNGHTGTHNHPVLMLIAFVSYYILVRPPKVQTCPSQGLS